MGDCYIKKPNIMYWYDLGYEQYKLQVVIYALKISISPYTRAYIIMGFIGPLFANNLQDINKIFLATTEELPSIHPQFAVLNIFEEATFGL